MIKDLFNRKKKLQIALEWKAKENNNFGVQLSESASVAMYNQFLLFRRIFMPVSKDHKKAQIVIKIN
jgi:hypothetical protein